MDEIAFPDRLEDEGHDLQRVADLLLVLFLPDDLVEGPDHPGDRVLLQFLKFGSHLLQKHG